MNTHGDYMLETSGDLIPRGSEEEWSQLHAADVAENMPWLLSRIGTGPQYEPWSHRAPPTLYQPDMGVVLPFRRPNGPGK